MFGAIREFDPSIDDWNSYTERLIANDAVSMKQKHAILLNSVGAGHGQQVSHTTYEATSCNSVLISIKDRL